MQCKGVLNLSFSSHSEQQQQKEKTKKEKEKEENSDISILEIKPSEIEERDGKGEEQSLSWYLKQSWVLSLSQGPCAAVFQPNAVLVWGLPIKSAVLCSAQGPCPPASSL